MPDMHLRQLAVLVKSELTYELFPKNKEKHKYSKKKEGLRYIYQNMIDKAYFQHSMGNGDFKDLPRRTVFDKVLHDKAFDIGRNPKCYKYQRRPALVVLNFLIRRLLVLLLRIKLCQTNN